MESLQYSIRKLIREIESDSEVSKQVKEDFQLSLLLQKAKGDYAAKNYFSADQELGKLVNQL